MEFDFEVGSLVVCIKRPEHGSPAAMPLKPNITFPEKGYIYTIRGHLKKKRLYLYLYLEEILNPKTLGFGEVAFASKCFRPLRKDEREVFTSLLTKLPQLEDA